MNPTPSASVKDLDTKIRAFITGWNNRKHGPLETSAFWLSLDGGLDRAQRRA